MAKSKIRIGILGAGAMGTEHADVYRAIEGVEVAGVFSRTSERATTVANICNARAATDPHELIEDPTIDAIDVCLPTIEHRAFVVAALGRGKHVFCETPFALSLEDAEAMAEAARKSGRVLLVGLLVRSIADYEHVQRIATSGELGKLLSVTAYRLGSYLRPDAPDHKAHYSDPSTELMTFDFDFVQWLMGPPIRLTASAVNTAAGTPGEITAVLDYGGNRNATVLASGMMPSSFPFTLGFRVLFEDGAFEMETVFKGGPPEGNLVFYPKRGDSQVLSIAGHNPYEKELQRFVDCIRGEGDKTLLDSQRAIETLKLSLATQLSLRDRRAIDVGSIRS